MQKNGNGIVYLVGAGPGDPGLLTLRGREYLEIADVVVYDYLASPRLLKFAKEGAQFLYVGKKGGDHTLSQDGINALIVEKALEGNKVVRLKGGDPFIFGRGGEEIEELIKAQIPYKVVPGVTSPIAAPAYAGIPLTHRKFTSSVSFITGHENPHKKESGINWKAFAENKGTLVFLMGVKNLPNIVAQLQKHGKSPQTPVALVRWGTTSKQQTVAGTLDNIVERVQEAKLKSPSIIVVGDVVSLRKTMKWFEDRPLMGKKIVITRARAQASDLVDRLSELGAECMECPTIKITAPEDSASLTEAMGNLSAYDWIVFTSVNGVDFFFKELFKSGLDVRSLSKISTACIGPVTAKRLLDFGLKSDIIPESYRAESIVKAFSKEKLNGKKFFLPRASEARMVIPVELEKMGASVHEVAVYQTIKVDSSKEQLLELLENNEVDLVTFTSSSTVVNFCDLLPQQGKKRLMDGVTVASIGPITSETALKEGFDVHISAKSFTIDGLVDSILKFYEKL